MSCQAGKLCEARVHQHANSDGLFRVSAWCIGSSADLALHQYKAVPSPLLQLFQMLCLSAVAVPFADYFMTMQDPTCQHCLLVF